MQEIGKRSQRLSPPLERVVIRMLVYLAVEQLIQNVVRATAVSLSDSFLWITSPTGKTTVKLPFYTALHVVRKRGWRLTEVEPIRRVSRWEGLQVFLFGDYRGGIPR